MNHLLQERRELERTKLESPSACSLSVQTAIPIVDRVGSVARSSATKKDGRAEIQAEELRAEAGGCPKTSICVK